MLLPYNIINIVSKHLYNRLNFLWEKKKAKGDVERYGKGEEYEVTEVKTSGKSAVVREKNLPVRKVLKRPYRTKQPDLRDSRAE